MIMMPRFLLPLFVATTTLLNNAGVLVVQAQAPVAGQEGQKFDVLEIGLGIPPTTLGRMPLTAMTESRTALLNYTTAGDGKVKFNKPVSLDYLRDGGGPNTLWSHGYKGYVYFTWGQTSLTIDLAQEVNAFVWYMESMTYDFLSTYSSVPNTYIHWEFRVTYEDGVTLVRQPENREGFDTAHGYGVFKLWNHGTPMKIEIVTDDEGGFLLGEMFYSTAEPPAPAVQDAAIAGQIESRQIAANTAVAVPSCGSCLGDPHFQTWDGQWYDFHGECDLVFLHNPTFANGKGMDIHIRTTMMAGVYSYIERAALRIGDDVLEVASYNNYILNGVADAELSTFFADKYPITHEVVDEKVHFFTIKLSNDASIVFKSFKQLVSVKLEGATKVVFGKSQGLMGQFETGIWQARNGTHVIQEANQFGLEWQVRDTEPQLFESNRAPQYPAQCILPDPAKKKGRRLGEGLPRRDVEQACAHWGAQKDLCIMDVMATGDMELAQSGP